MPWGFPEAAMMTAGFTVTALFRWMKRREQRQPWPRHYAAIVLLAGVVAIPLFFLALYRVIAALGLRLP